MPVKNGKLYICSRSAATHKRKEVPKEFVEDGDESAAKRWLTVSFDDVMGVPTEVVICEECREKYESMMATWNRDVREFMEEGK